MPTFSFLAIEYYLMTTLELITQMAEKVTRSEGLSLYEVEFKKEGRKMVLRIFIDSPRGVRLDDCENISHQMSNLLDVEDIIDGPYLLEVSSPGLDRKLRNAKDFVDHIGRLIKVKTSEPRAGVKVLRGRLISYGNSLLLLEDNKQRRYEIPYSIVLEVRLEVEF